MNAEENRSRRSLVFLKRRVKSGLMVRDSENLTVPMRACAGLFESFRLLSIGSCHLTSNLFKSGRGHCARLLRNKHPSGSRCTYHLSLSNLPYTANKCATKESPTTSLVAQSVFAGQISANAKAISRSEIELPNVLPFFQTIPNTYVRGTYLCSGTRASPP